MLRLQEIEFYNTPDCEVMIKPKGEPVRVLTERGRKIGNSYLPSSLIWSRSTQKHGRR